jgi:hypothetical protein
MMLRLRTWLNDETPGFHQLHQASRLAIDIKKCGFEEIFCPGWIAIGESCYQSQNQKKIAHSSSSSWLEQIAILIRRRTKSLSILSISGRSRSFPPLYSQNVPLHGLSRIRNVVEDSLEVKCNKLWVH